LLFEGRGEEGEEEIRIGVECLSLRRVGAIAILNAERCGETEEGRRLCRNLDRGDLGNKALVAPASSERGYLGVITTRFCVAGLPMETSNGERVCFGEKFFSSIVLKSKEPCPRS
jgi:hypothetical protein